MECQSKNTSTKGRTMMCTKQIECPKIKTERLYWILCIVRPNVKIGIHFAFCFFHVVLNICYWLGAQRAPLSLCVCMCVCRSFAFDAGFVCIFKNCFGVGCINVWKDIRDGTKSYKLMTNIFGTSVLSLFLSFSSSFCSICFLPFSFRFINL